MREFKVGGVEAGPGTRGTGLMTTWEGAGISVRTPIFVVNGASKGPCLLVLSGLHGDEYDSSIAAERIAKVVDPRNLRGTLVTLPITNMLAWQARSYESPDDKEDMSYAFPGDPLGSRTEQVAHRIFSELVPRCDVLIDLHNGNTVNMVAKHSYHPRSGKKSDDSRELAHAFGFPILVETEPFPGLLMCEAAKLGIVSITAECGGEGRVHDKLVEDTLEGLTNAMRHLGMVDGKVAPSGKPTLAVWSPRAGLEGHLLARHSGYLDLLVAPGDEVSKGQTVAHVTDLSGRRVETLKAPYDTVVTELRTWATVNAGEIVAFLPVLREKPPGL